MTLEILGQIFGVLGFLVAIFTFTQKNDIKLKLSLIAMFALQTIHFMLLGSTTGMIANGLNFLRTIVSIKSNHKSFGIVFILLNIIWGASNVERWIDIFPIFGACIGTYAIFYASGITMRRLFICGALFWLTNNIYIGSIGGVLLELSVIVVNSFTIYRLKKDIGPSHCKHNEQTN